MFPAASGKRFRIKPIYFCAQSFFKESASRIEMSLKSWIKRLGFWGFMFFLLKGLLWLTIPALIAIFASE
jgi:hypothetical protein